VRPKATNIMDLPISFQKVAMHLFFLLLIFRSFTYQDSDTATLNSIKKNVPKAVTMSNMLNEQLPLEVNFTENTSCDGIGIVRSKREFRCDLPSVPSMSGSFINPSDHNLAHAINDISLTAHTSHKKTVSK